jgi:hypothetical protein
MRQLKSNEEKVAEKIAKLIEGLTLDLEEVGKYFGRFLPSTLYHRLMVIAESAKFEREENGSIE